MTSLVLVPSLAALALIGAADASELTLDGAIAAALARSEDVLRADQDVLLAEIERVRAVASVLPSINMSASANGVFYEQFITEARSGTYGDFIDVQGSAEQGSFAFTLTARQILLDGGRWWTLLARVGDIRGAREAALAAVRANVRLTVVRRFYDLAKARRAVGTFGLQVERAIAQLDGARASLESGRGKRDEVAAAERNLAADRVTLARRIFTESTRTRALNLVLGRDPDMPLTIAVPRAVETSTAALAPIVVPDDASMTAQAIAGRPEVKQGLAALATIRKNITIRAAELYPAIGLNMTYARASRRFDRVFDDPFGDFYAILGLDLRWNVFGGGVASASVEEAEIELVKAEALHRDLVRAIRSEVLEKSEQLRLLVQVLELNRAGARAAGEATANVRRLYGEGRATLLELRDAEFRSTQADDALYEARFDIEVAREELRRAVGADVERLPSSRPSP